MPIESVLDAITPHQAEVLGVMAESGTVVVAARRLGVTAGTIRSQLRTLRQVTETQNLAQLLLWWRDHRGQWLAHLATRAGIPSDEVPEWQVPARR
jgi:DNA-binding CsgD family transcriptional regulator